MKRTHSLSLTLLLSVMPCLLGAQPVIKEYKGPFSNGMSHPAEVEYEYYDDIRTGDPVMHGRFKYTVRDTDGDEKFNQNFRGMYVDGLKDGQWTYRTSMRDYERDDDGLFLTGNITLIAEYAKGLPQGRWEYSWSMKGREHMVVDGTEKWSRYSDTRKISIVLTFDKGMLIDSVRVTDTHGMSIFGIFDKQGFFHQDWIFLTDTTEEISGYEHGVLMTHTYRYLSAERFEKDEVFAGNRKKRSELLAALPKGKTALDKLSFTADTTSIFGRMAHPLRTIVLERVYSDRDFLYSYIHGDLNYRYDEKMRYFKMDMPGAYLVTFTVKLSSAEQAKYTTLRKTRWSVGDTRRKAELYARGKTLPHNLQNSVSAIQYNDKLAEAYNCLAVKIAGAETVAEGKAEAAGCPMVSSIIDGIPDSMSKAEAFDQITRSLAALKETSDRYYEQIRKYKG